MADRRRLSLSSSQPSIRLPTVSDWLGRSMSRSRKLPLSASKPLMLASERLKVALAPSSRPFHGAGSQSNFCE
ncbi:hypothetical protein D3C78_1830140 [compost metagenome]